MDSNHSHINRRKDVDTYLQNKQLPDLNKKRAETEVLKGKYKHLKAVHDLQNRTVRHFMHNVMSPLSAVSGYLELLSNNLNGDTDNKKLERYSGNISDGLNEIGFLLEQLHDIFKEEQAPGDAKESPVVELNWLVNEVKNIVSNSSEIKSAEVLFTESKTPVYVKAELFQLKLMIYNLVTTADCFSTNRSKLEIEVERDKSEFALLIRSTGNIAPDDVFMNAFRKRDIVRLSDDIDENSPILLGLKICAQIADQINGNIIMDIRDRSSPQFVLTAPLAEGNGSY
ncbi:hypothetical protein BH23BAC3_BH23BAC3_00600 [soil metagenome]